MGEIVQFNLPKAKPESSLVDGEIQVGSLVRVVNTFSPFFVWEGYVTNIFDGPLDTGKHAQIACAHKGFQFPVLTFALAELTLVSTKGGNKSA